MKAIRIMLVLLGLYVSNMAYGGNIPKEINNIIFEQSDFSRPLSIIPGKDDGERAVEYAKSRRVDNGLLPWVVITEYLNFDKKLLAFLVKNKFSYVECVRQYCFVVHMPKIKSLERAAHRELVSIDYQNKYTANVFGVSIPTYAVTFTYRIRADIPEAPKIEMTYKGEGKAVLNPDTGKWKLDNLKLEDRGIHLFQEIIQKDYPPFDKSEALRAEVPSAGSPGANATPITATGTGTSQTGAEVKPQASEGQMLNLARGHKCFACHDINKKAVGPAWRDVATKYRGVDGAEDRLVDKVSRGGAGVWGRLPEIANSPKVPQADIRTLVQFILSLGDAGTSPGTSDPHDSRVSQNTKDAVNAGDVDMASPDDNTNAPSGGKSCGKKCADEYGMCLTVSAPAPNYIKTVCDPKRDTCLKKCSGDR